MTPDQLSYPAWQQFPNGKLENLFPAPNRRIQSAPPLESDPADAGTDEANGHAAASCASRWRTTATARTSFSTTTPSTGGMTVYIEDGVEDGDETVDMYVIPTWGTESVQDVLTRYFPARPRPTTPMAC